MGRVKGNYQGCSCTRTASNREENTYCLRLKEQFARSRETGVCWTCVRACVLASSVAQLCPTLCDPLDCSPPGSSVHGIIQARMLEWVAIFSSRGSS